VIAYAYGPAAEIWWRGIEAKLARLERNSISKESLRNHRCSASWRMNLFSSVGPSQLVETVDLARVWTKFEEAPDG